MASLAAELRAGHSSPDDAVSVLARTGVEVLGRSVRSIALEGPSVDMMPIPDVLLTEPSLELALAVTHYQPRDESWGRFIALVIVAGKGPRA
jgi:hypothetical protein